MTTDNRPKPSTPIKNFLLGAFMMASVPTVTNFFYALGQHSQPQAAYVQEADWLEVVAQAEKPYRKGVKR